MRPARQDDGPPKPPEPPKAAGKLVLVDVPKTTWTKRLLKLFAFALLSLVTAAIVGVAGAWLKYGSDLPAIPRVEMYHPSILTEIWSQDAGLSGELYAEQRKVV